MITLRSFLICVYILVCACTNTFSQASLKDLDYWTRELSKKGMPIDSGYLKLQDYLTAWEILQQRSVSLNRCRRKTSLRVRMLTPD